MAYNRKKEEKLDYQALRSKTEKMGPKRLYLLWGEERYLLHNFVRTLQKLCAQDDGGEFNSHVIDCSAPDLNGIEEAVNAMPFMGEHTFVELEDFDLNSLRSGKDDSSAASAKSKTKKQEDKADTMIRILSDIPEWCTVVIVFPVGVAPDGRKGHIKTLKSLGESIDFTEQDSDLLYQWIRQQCKQCGKKIGREAMDRLMFLSGTLMSSLMPEIRKVAGYAQGDEITAGDVNAVAHHIPEADVFLMTQALADRNYERALASLRELLDGGTEPENILGVISWQMRRLYGAKLCDTSHVGIGQLCDIWGVKEYSAKQNMDTARKFSLRELRNDIRICTDITLALRDGSGTLERDDAVKEIVLRFAAEAAHA